MSLNKEALIGSLIQKLKTTAIIQVIISSSHIAALNDGKNLLHKTQKLTLFTTKFAVFITKTTNSYILQKIIS